MMLGLGQPTTSNTPPSYPWWCSIMPAAFATSSMAQECGVQTQAQINQEAQASIQKAAGGGTPNYNPALAQQQYQQFLQDEQAYCADPANAANCAAWKQAQPGATCSTIFGSGMFGQSVCGNPSAWILGAAAVIGLLVALKSI